MQIARFYFGFYYDQLDIDQQALYRKVAKAVANYVGELSLDPFVCSSLRKVLMAVKYDSPEFAYWNMTESKAEEGCLVLRYYTKEEDAVELVEALREKRKQILQEFKMETASAKDSGEKGTMTGKIYDYLVHAVSYADAELERPMEHLWINEAEGPLLKGRGVCLGIAFSLKYLLDGLLIDNLLITGKAKVAGCYCNHAWNMVALDGKYYHLDATVDLWVRASDTDNEGLTDRTWAKDIYPSC